MQRCTHLIRHLGGWYILRTVFLQINRTILKLRNVFLLKQVKTHRYNYIAATQSSSRSALYSGVVNCYLWEVDFYIAGLSVGKQPDSKVI